MSSSKVKVKKGMRPQSAKAKGRRLQQRVARDLVNLFSGVLDFDDCRSTSMGASGDDVLLSPLAQRLIPCDFECKNEENLTIWSALRQCAKRGEDRRDRFPVVVAGRNRRNPVAVVPFGWLYATVENTEMPWQVDGSAMMGHTLLDKLVTLPWIHPESWRGVPIRAVDTKTMKFWPTVDAAEGILVFNRGDVSHVIWAAVSWDHFLHVVRKHAELKAPHRLVPPPSPGRPSEYSNAQSAATTAITTTPTTAAAEADDE